MKPSLKLFYLAVIAGCCWLAGGSMVLAQQNPETKLRPVKTLRVNGVELGYIEQGRGEPVVLLHGFLLDYRSWLAQMDALGEHFRVIAYSQRYRYPNGPAPPGAEVNLATDIADLAALIQKLQLGRVHIVGHSRGGNLAILFARKHPNLVRALVLAEGPPPRPVGQSAATLAASRPPFFADAVKAYERGDVDGTLEIFLQGVLGPRHGVVPPIVGQMARANAWQIKSLTSPDLSESPFTCGDAQALKVPVFYMLGEWSPPQFQASAEAWKKCLPASEQAILPQSSHGLELENPAGFNRVVLNLLSGRSGQTRRMLRVKTVHVPGATLAYVEQGRGEPVVFIHGWLWDYRAWSAEMPELSKRYHAIAYSRRYNYPNTPTGGGKDYSTETDVKDLIALIQKLKLGPAHLVGHSAGANIALLVARDHPELVRSLTLGEAFTPDLIVANPEAQASLERLLAVVDKAFGEFQKGDPIGAARMLAGGIVGKTDAFDQMPPDRQSQILENMQVEMKAQLSSPQKPEPPFGCEDARSIKAPTLLVEGEHTLPLIVSMDDALLGCISGSKRQVLPGATHALQLETPGKFNEILLDFLSRPRQTP